MKHPLIALMALSAWNAAAAGMGTAVQVGATILASCTSTGTSLDFGASIDPLATHGAIDPARSKIWGEGGMAYSGIGTGSPQNLTIYGRLPSLAGVVPGNYSDTVTVTISF